MLPESLYSWQFWGIVIPSVAGIASVLSIIPSLVRPPYSRTKTVERLVAALTFFVMLAGLLAIGVSVSLGLYYLERQSLELIKIRPMDLQNKRSGAISSSWDLPTMILVLGLWSARWLTILATAIAPFALLGGKFELDDLFRKAKPDAPDPTPVNSGKRTCRSCGQKTPKNIARCYHCGAVIS